MAEARGSSAASNLPQFTSGRTAALMLAPALLIAALFFVVPMIAVFINSFTVESGGATHFTLSNYTDFLSDDFYWEIMLRTLRISLITTLVALMVGYPAALYLYFSQSRWRRVFLFLVVSPLFVSVIVRTYGWIVILSPNGAINALLPEDYKLSLMHTDTAIVLGLMHIYIPFMVLSLNASLVKVDKRLLAAAASLGASNWRIFRDVLFKLSLPGVLSGSVIVFAISMTAFSTPVLLGGSSRKTLAYLVYQQNLLLANWHAGAAIAFVLLAMTLIIVKLITLAAERGTKHTVPQ